MRLGDWARGVCNCLCYVVLRTQPGEPSAGNSTFGRRDNAARRTGLSLAGAPSFSCYEVDHGRCEVSFAFPDFAYRLRVFVPHDMLTVNSAREGSVRHLK